MDFAMLKKLFADNADPKEAEKMAAYARDKFVYFGIPTPKL
jgi:hypothetical protein